MTTNKSYGGHSFDFSAMICLYKNNRAKEVRDALDSALIEQDLPPLELIAVFDGPVPDDVVDIIDEFEDIIAIRRIVFPENRGHGPARAAAIDACRTPWIAIVDADDISRPDRFKRLIETAREYPESAVIGGGFTEFEFKGNEIRKGAEVMLPETPPEVRRFLQSRSPIAQPTAILRTDAIREVGGYKTWFNNEDYFLWLRLAAAGFTMRNIPHSLILFRTNPELYKRRGGVRYWWGEVELQLFSLQNGTTTLPKFLAGALVRFLVQVLLPGRVREQFYRIILRRK